MVAKHFIRQTLEALLFFFFKFCAIFPRTKDLKEKLTLALLHYLSQEMGSGD